jgi:YD repeat-containing protein
MKTTTILLIWGFLVLSIGLHAQHSSNESIETSLRLYSQVKAKTVQQIKENQLKGVLFQKSATPYESYYILTYNDTTQNWDTLGRATFYIDTVGNSYHGTAIGELYTPQGYVKSDSSSVYTDSTYKYYKVFGNRLVIDSASAFLFDTISNSWVPFVEEYNLPNANGDLEVSVSNFGPLFTDSARYFYDSSQSLTHFLSWGTNFFMPNSPTIDSLVCQSNQSGYRTLDTIYQLDSNQQWQYSGRIQYAYDNQNNLTQEIDNDFVKYSYVYDLNNELIADSLYYFRGIGSNAAFELQSYSLYDQDSTTEFRIIGGIAEIQRIERFYYTNNQPDSTVRLQRFGSNSQLQFTDKDIYINLSIGLEDNERPNLSFQAYPNPVEDELFIECQNQELEVVIYDINGRERFRSIEKGNFKIDVSDFLRGIYLLRINDSVKKIVIQ